MRTFGSLSYNDGLWVLDAEPHVALRLKRMFGRARANRAGAIELRATDETAADIEWFLSRYPLDANDLTMRRLKVAATQHRESIAAAERIMGGERLRFDLEPAREPRVAQLEAADLCLTTGRLLLADALGGGKSFTGLLLLRHPDALPALVVCPTHLTHQWLGELALSFPGLRGHILRTGTPYDISRTRAMKGHQPDVIITTYAKLAGWAKHLAGGIRTVIFDEAQELRHHGTDKYFAAGLIADRAYFKIELTATPVYNYGGEAFNLLHIIATDALGTREEFTREWGAEISNGRVMVHQPRALGTYLREQRLLLARSDEELGIDRQKPLQIPHTLDADKKVITAESAGVSELARLILSGEGTREDRWRAAGEIDWRMRRATGLAKAPYVAAFVRLLLESEDKVLLFGWHRDVYACWTEIFEAADVGYVLYTGSESSARKEVAKHRFLTDPRTRVMVMSLRSGAGLDGLEQRCRVAVFGELDWAPGMHSQCIGRLNRNNQPHQVLAYFLTCDSGSDPAIMEVLGIKRGQAEPIRDPDVDLFETVPDTSDRVRLLAEAALRR